ERVQQPIRVMNLQVGRDSFGTETALVDREVITRLEPDDMVFFNQQVQTALDRAVRAVGRHNTVDSPVRAPAIPRLVVQVRAEFFNYLFYVANLTHAIS